MKGECIMKQVLIIAVVAIIAAVNFVMYCCLRVASQEDQMLEKLSRKRWRLDMQRTSRNPVNIVISGMKRKRNAGR